MSENEVKVKWNEQHKETITPSPFICGIYRESDMKVKRKHWRCRKGMAKSRRENEE